LSKLKMRLGHSPDPDDAFMFYAIAKEKITSDQIEIPEGTGSIQDHVLRCQYGRRIWAYSCC